MVGDFNIPFLVTDRTNRIGKTWISFNLFGKVLLFMNFILHLIELPFWVVFDLLEVFLWLLFWILSHASQSSMTLSLVFGELSFSFRVTMLPWLFIVFDALLLCWSIWSSEHRSGDGGQCLDDLDGGYPHRVHVTWIMGHHIMMVRVTCEGGGWVSKLTGLFNLSLWLLALLCCSHRNISTFVTKLCLRGGQILRC